jgi:hypothetical protein
MPQFKVGAVWPALRKIGQDTRKGQPRGHALVWQMARAELIDKGRGGNFLPPDSRGVLEGWRQAYRELGVVLVPAVEGLGLLDTYVYRPLRDVAFLTARSFDEEVLERASAGLPTERAFHETAVDWTEGFGTLAVLDDEALGERPDALFQPEDQRTGAALAHQRSFPCRLELLWRSREEAMRGRMRLEGDPNLAAGHDYRMAARRELFSRCEVDFEGPGHREVVRVIFVTSLMLADEVRGSARRSPAEDFETRYHWIAGQYRAVTARLVVGG